MYVAMKTISNKWLAILIVSMFIVCYYTLKVALTGEDTYDVAVCTLFSIIALYTLCYAIYEAIRRISKDYEDFMDDDEYPMSYS